MDMRIYADADKAAGDKAKAELDRAKALHASTPFEDLPTDVRDVFLRMAKDDIERDESDAMQRLFGAP